MDLSVIIVNFNVKYFLEQAIKSVLLSAKDHNVEVIVVDNQSHDGSTDMVLERFPQVRLIANDSNPGFSVANNQGLAIAKGKYVLFLNPDTIMAEDTIPKCLSYMDQHLDCGALGVRMVDGAGQFLPESKRGLPTPGVALSKMLRLHYLFPRSATFNHYYMGHIEEFQTAPVEVLTGAFMWVRKSILDTIGGFDETFFMYGEDIDLSYRIQQTGSSIIYFPETSIIHYKGESTKKGSLNYVRHFYNAMLIFSNKHFKSSYSALLRVILFLGVYFGAFMAIANRVFKNLFWPLVDIGILIATILLFKNFWAIYYYQDPDYYPDSFYWFNLPVYVMVWVGVLFFSGAYDKPYKFGRLVKAMIIGLLINGLIYGLLDNPLRPSRAVMIVTFVLGTASMFLSRWVGHYIKFKKWPLNRNLIKRIAVVAPGLEASQIGALASSLRGNSEVVGYVADRKEGDMPHLGQPTDLDSIVRACRINEIIFSTEEYTASRVMTYMKELGPDLHYKIAASGSGGVVGSSNKNSSGEMYTMELHYNLSQPEYRRYKRLFDIFVAAVSIIFFPIVIWLVKDKNTFAKHLVRVITGRYTWIGYAGSGSDVSGLPDICPGVYPIISEQNRLNVPSLILINRQYAERYNITMDAEILWESMRGAEVT